MFAWERGKLLRLLRNPEHVRAMQWEAAAARAASVGGVRVPATYESLAIGGRPGIVVERIDGKDLLEEIAAKPWRVWSIGSACGALHARLNSVPAGAELPELRERLADQIRRSDRVPERYAESRCGAGGAAEGTACVMGTSTLGTYCGQAKSWWIDWPNAACGDYHADFARSTLMLRLGDPPPGTRWLIRFGAKFARVLVKSSYERGYERGMDVDTALHKRWETVRAVHRLTDGIESERGKLLRLLNQRLSA
jgi:hypothetical protein